MGKVLKLKMRLYSFGLSVLAVDSTSRSQPSQQESFSSDRLLTDFQAENIDEELIDFSKYEDRVAIVVNVASE